MEVDAHHVFAVVVVMAVAVAVAVAAVVMVGVGMARCRFRRGGGRGGDGRIDGRAGGWDLRVIVDVVSVTVEGDIRV